MQYPRSPNSEGPGAPADRVQACSLDWGFEKALSETAVWRWRRRAGGAARWVLVVAVLSGLGAARAGAQRLPGGVRPTHYALTITPDLQAATFAGAETIDVVLSTPTRVITLNAAEIEFGVVRARLGVGLADPTHRDETAMDGAHGILLPTHRDETAMDGAHGFLCSPCSAEPKDGAPGIEAAVALDAGKQQATLTFARELPAGPVALEIAFTGKLNDKLRGFYLSKTKTRRYGVTQFEATDARRAFPSFDEPALKATFDVTLVVDRGDTAISNTKLLRDTPGPVAGKHTLVFGTTPKMSTYLVAWLVGDFQCRKGKQDGVPIRACATPERADETKFALQAAKWMLHYYDGYFGIKYPMEKLDLVAIPDFEAGAMENFGCITFRETEMLVDPKNGSLPAMKEVAQTVAHEMAHQWFGDLVTPAWWDNIWLNEGFATWMETKAAAAWHPKWEYEQDVAVDRNHVIDEDAQRTTRAIRAQAETPDEINELFDDIAYGKAGAVIAMVENWEGEETFRQGVQAYLQAHLYANATAQDFWTAQAQVSHMPADAVMRSFVEQPGVPEVRLGAVQAGSVMAEQMRFRISGEDSSEPAQTWTLPICLRMEVRGVQQCDVLQPAKGSLALAGGVGTLFANAGDKGYYLTSYSAEQSKALTANVETALSAEERIGLLGDRWALMRSGQGTLGEFLDLALAVKRDASATVLDTALGRIAYVEERVATPADRTRLDYVVQREFGPVYMSLGGGGRHESFDHAQLRAVLFEALGEAKAPAVMAQAQALTNQVFAGQLASDQALSDTALTLATPKGDAAMYDRLLRMTKSVTDPDTKEASLHVLARFEAPALVERTLEYAVSDEMRSQDGWMLISQLLQQPETQDQAWTFVGKHWAQVEKKATLTSEARIVEAAGAFCSVEKRGEVEAFFKTHRVPSSERTLAKALEAIDGCVQLRATGEPQLHVWLDHHSTE